jgi:DNA-directed RNA polymerase-5 subunit 1
VIAGIFYHDINKVKSKSRAILNLKKDGEKIEGNDSDFLKELLQLHEKSETKLKNFSHFEAGVHPLYEKTRCFFVVRTDGSKEDFSVTKCIVNLENA